MKYSISYLLTASRVPDHFYPLVKGLDGRDILYRNPGSSLRSFVLSGTNVLQELIEVDGVMKEVLEECEDFTNDEKVYGIINHALRSQPYDIVERILEIGKSPSAIKGVMARLNAMNKNVEDAWDVLGKNTVAGEPRNFWSPEAADYKQSIIDLKFYASELAGHLETLQGQRK